MLHTTEQEYIKHCLKAQTVSLAFQHLSLYHSVCCGLWFLLVSTERTCSTAHLPHGFFLQFMCPLFRLLASERRIKSLTLQDIYHLFPVNDNCIQSGFTIIT